MSLKNFTIKSALLQGPIKKKLVYQLCPSTEFSEGVWNLSIASVSYSTNNPDDKKDIFSISCNVVKSQKLSSSNEIENYNQPLNTFLIETKKKQTIYFNAHWFRINAISNELKFTIKNETNSTIEYDGLVYLHVLFQKTV
jgi:hypothetical protein